MLFDDLEANLHPICFICGLDSIAFDFFFFPTLFCVFVENLQDPCLDKNSVEQQCMCTSEYG